MGAFLGFFGAFVLLVVMVVFSHQGAAALTDRIVQLQRKRKKLISQISDLKQATRDLKETEVFLNQQADELGAPNDLALGEDLLLDAAPPSSQAADVGSFSDVLLKEKLITSEQLEKAEVYLLQTGTPYSIDEVLVMLGYVSPEVISRLKAKYPHLG